MKDLSTELKSINLKNGKFEHIKFGFSELDDSLRLSRNGGQIIVLGSRPSMGKSALALNIASGFAESQKRGVAYFSLEMTSEEISLRLLAQRGHLDSNKLKAGKIDNADLDKLTQSIQELSNLPIYITDDCDIEIERIESCLDDIKDKVGLVVIDNLQLFKFPEDSKERLGEVDKIMRKLKLLAKELKVTIILLSQLNRGLEARHNKRPQTSDLRESGSIEQDADVIMFLYRDNFYDFIPDCDDIAEINIVKNRNGRTGTVCLKWNPDYIRFEDV